MRSSRLLFLVILASALYPSVGIAQERARPVFSDHLWTSISVTGRPPKFFNDIIGKEARKRIRLNGELGYRSADAFFAGRQIYFDGGIRYKLSDLVSIGAEQRFAYRPGREDRTRTLVQLYLGQDIGRWELGYRFRYQHNYRAFGTQRELFRHRFKLGYNFRKWKLDPYVTTEFFTWANPAGLSYIGTRYRLGTTYRLGKAHSLGVAVLHDRERELAWPEHRTIYSVDYSFNITRAERRKKKQPTE